MERKKVLAGALALVLVLAVLVLVVFFAMQQPTSARPRVLILPNGNVEPASAPIHRDVNVYTFTDDVYAELVIERSDVVINGSGFTLHGPYNGTQENLWIIGEGSDQVSPGMQIPYSVGVDLSGDASGLTITDLNIMNFSIGTYIWTTNNSFVGNSVAECVVGVLLSGSNNSVTRNYLATNEVGLFFGTNEPGTVPLNLTVSHNSFVDNVRQLGGCLCREQYNASEPIHTWDDGKEGNYWNDYNGTDANGDGIGDTAYVFDPQNKDRYPLMESIATPPTVTSGVPIGVEVLVLIVVVLALVASLVVWNAKRLRRNQTQMNKSVP